MAWMCQESGSKRLGKMPPVMKTTIHKASASAAQIAAARKNGRKAKDHKLAGGLLIERGAAVATIHLVRWWIPLRRGSTETALASRTDTAAARFNNMARTGAKVCASATLLTARCQSGASSEILRISEG